MLPFTKNLYILCTELFLKHLYTVIKIEGSVVSVVAKDYQVQQDFSETLRLFCDTSGKDYLDFKSRSLMTLQVSDDYVTALY